VWRWLRHPRVLDALIGLALALATLWEDLAYYGASTVTQRAVIAVRVLGAVALMWRRVAPIPVALFVVAGLGLPALFGPSYENLSNSIVVIVAVYSGVAYAPSWSAAVLVAGALAVAATVRSYVDYGDAGGAIISQVLYAAVLFSIGAVVRRHHDQNAASERRAAAAEQAREAHAAAAVAAERARIARELHDVVAHAISVIVLQARGGRRMLDMDQAESRTAFQAVEAVSEQALVDMRRLIGLLREDDDPDHSPYAPQPSLRHLDLLLAQATLPDTTKVDLKVAGDLSSLPPGIDITAYRIVQEALTNIRKHTSARSVQVSVTVDGSTLNVTVADDGTAPTGDNRPTDGNDGFGILGMRERVALFGGDLHAGQRPEGGFEVIACLPLPTVTP
jgi:signal transduction histidine kinase